MGLHKALRPDCLHAVFFQRYWGVVGESVCRVVLGILNERKSLGDINKTQVVLIPKVKSLRSITEFRPISLCNVTYKIVTKPLANRLKVVLPCVTDSS